MRTFLEAIKQINFVAANGFETPEIKSKPWPDKNQPAQQFDQVFKSWSLETRKSQQLYHKLYNFHVS